jgi:hypothetical protein
VLIHKLTGMLREATAKRPCGFTHGRTYWRPRALAPSVAGAAGPRSATHGESDPDPKRPIKPPEPGEPPISPPKPAKPPVRKPPQPAETPPPPRQPPTKPPVEPPSPDTH